MTPAHNTHNYIVVWSGRMPLLPPRSERYDDRFNRVESLTDEEIGLQVARGRPRITRAYTKSGRYSGNFSRTLKINTSRRVGG